MKHIVLLTIKVYWLFIPSSNRKKCLFSESCSKYVYRTTKEDGFLYGLKALVLRFKSCKPGYQIIKINGEAFMLTINNKLFKNKEIRKDILNPTN